MYCEQCIFSSVFSYCSFLLDVGLGAPHPAAKKPTPSWLLDDVHEEPAHTQLDSKTSPPAPPPPVVAAAAASTGLPAPSPKPASQPTPAFSMASSDVNRSTAAGGGTGGLESSSNRDGDRVKEENKQLQAEVGNAHATGCAPTLPGNLLCDV